MRWGWRACTFVALAATLAPRGHAQEPAPAPPEEGASAPAEPAPTLTGSLRDTWWWVRVGPIGGGPMSDVAIHPDVEGLHAVTSLSGKVWLTLDAGVSWVSVLPALGSSLGDTSIEERVLLEVESRLDELMGDVEVDELGEEIDPEDYVDDPEGLEAAQQELEDRASELEQESADAARTAIDEVQTELQSDPWFLEQQEVLAGSRLVARPRVWFTTRGWLVVGRADGLWISRDLGGSWTHAIRDVPVSAMLEHDGGLLVGTSDGLRWSGDLVAWEDPEDGTEGLRVHHLDRMGDRLVAGTDRGVWTAADRSRWTVVPGLEVPVLAVLVDRFWEDGLWLATPRTILRSDDGGRTTREPLGAPIGGVVSMVLLEMDHVVAAGDDGTWESLDGGSTWAPVTQGLADPDTRGLALQDTVVLLTSDEGVFRLEPVREVEEMADEELRAALESFVPVNQLLDAALLRPELQAHAGGRALAYLAPQLTLEGRYATGNRLVYEPELGSTRELDAVWQVLMRLQWTPPGRQTGDLYVEVGAEDVTVLDGTSQVVAASSVSRGATEYRSHLAAKVTEMHAARAQLVGAWPEVREGSVLDQTLHALRIQELEAQLDALTDGAVSRWRHGEG